MLSFELHVREGPNGRDCGDHGLAQDNTTADPSNNTTYRCHCTDGCEVQAAVTRAEPAPSKGGSRRPGPLGPTTRWDIELRAVGTPRSECVLLLWDPMPWLGGV